MWLPKAGQQRMTQAGVAAHAVQGDLIGRGRRTFRERASLAMRAVEARAAGPEGNLLRRSRQARGWSRPAPGHGPWSRWSRPWSLRSRSRSRRNPRLSRRRSQRTRWPGAASGPGVRGGDCRRSSGFHHPISRPSRSKHSPNHSISRGVRGPRRIPNTIDDANIAMLVR